VRVLSRVFEDTPSEYLGFFATELAKAEKTIGLVAGKEDGQLVFAQHPSAGKDMNALVKKVLEKMGGKGGGTRDFARGKLQDPGRSASVLTLAREILASA
jgi:alanyl-tRNA synthetase